MKLTPIKSRRKKKFGLLVQIANCRRDHASLPEWMRAAAKWAEAKGKL